MICGAADEGSAALFVWRGFGFWKDLRWGVCRYGFTG